MKLSVVIPVYNERDQLPILLGLAAKALPDVPKELVLVDDGSNDGTREWMQAQLPNSGGPYSEMQTSEDGQVELTSAEEGEIGTFTLLVLYHERNQGKGAAVRTGLGVASGEVLLIQDADLEYDPSDWEQMWELITIRKVADVVYGSRFYGRPHRSLFFHHYLANRLISLLFNILYNQTLTDVEVCYKMFTRPVLDSLRLSANDFGFEIQISSQIARQRKLRLYEVGISYYGRTYADGKKINWKDGLKALWYLIRFRL